MTLVRRERQVVLGVTLLIDDLLVLLAGYVVLGLTICADPGGCRFKPNWLAVVAGLVLISLGVVVLALLRTHEDKAQ